MPVSEHDVVRRAVGIFRRELEDENQHIEDALRVALRAVFADATAEVERLREANRAIGDRLMERAAERDEARAEVERLREIVRDVAACGVSYDEPRVRYVEVQIDRDTWQQVRDESHKNA